MKDILKFISIVLITIASFCFIFLTKSNTFETLTIAIIYAIFMEVMIPDKEK